MLVRDVHHAVQGEGDRIIWIDSQNTIHETVSPDGYHYLHVPIPAEYDPCLMSDNRWESPWLKVFTPGKITISCVTM